MNFTESVVEEVALAELEAHRYARSAARTASRIAKCIEAKGVAP